MEGRAKTHSNHSKVSPDHQWHLTAGEPTDGAAEKAEHIKFIQHVQDMNYQVINKALPGQAVEVKKLKAVAEETQRSAVELTGRTERGTDLVGGGFIVATQGSGQNGTCDIATDNHVAKRFVGNFDAQLQNGEKYSAKIVKQNPQYETAIVRISAVADPSKTCPVLPLGEPEKLQPGELVARVSQGQPHMPGMYTGKTVRSAVPRVKMEEGERTDRTIHVFSLASEQGNSGSAIVNLQGRAVDLTWSGGGNVTGGTPVDALKRDVDELHPGPTN